MIRCFRFDSIDCPDFRAVLGVAVTIEPGALTDDQGTRAAVVVKLPQEMEALFASMMTVSPISIWNEASQAPVQGLEPAWVQEEIRAVKLAEAEAALAEATTVEIVP